MHRKKKDLNEQELRRKIQDKLEKKYGREKETSENGRTTDLKSEPGLFPTSTGFPTDDHIRQTLSRQICARHPEFIRCSNHLEEVRWLTPAELEKDFEFYPYEEGWWTRFKQHLFGYKKESFLNDPEIKDRVERIRAEVEQDVQRRIEEYRQYRERAKKQFANEEERKIYEEEIDRFFRKKPGYKKYRNHAGETRWMSKEEFLNQDEYFEEVLSTGQIVRRRIAVALVILLVAAGIWQLTQYYRVNEETHSFLLVEENEQRGLLYIDKNPAIGFRPGIPYPVKPGPHEISMILSGYTTKPKVQQVNLAKNDTARIAFRFQKIDDRQTGIVKIKTPYSDAALMVNGEFEGTISSQPLLKLPPGAYTITLEKGGYFPSPPQRVVNLHAGDTLSVVFNLSRRSRSSAVKKTANLLKGGLVEIHSNIKNADILLDGQQTGFQTDYVLQRIPFGQHRISVYKKGYKAYPDEKRIKLSSKQKRVSVNFTLTSTFRPITLKTAPVKGTIILDGKEVGSGSVKLSVPLGKHQIDFGPIPHYHKPKDTIINLTDQTPDQLVFNYILNFFVSFSPGGTPPRAGRGSVATGYLLNDDRFRLSNKAGPKVKKNAKIKDSVWMVGYAFQYRNPPGKDALLFNFEVPENVDTSEPIYLYVYAYQTKDYYPLVIKGKSFYRIDINGQKFRKQIEPKYRLTQIGPDHYDKYLINEFLHVGYNRILFSTTNATSAHVALWKLVIK